MAILLNSNFIDNKLPQFSMKEFYILVISLYTSIIVLTLPPKRSIPLQNEQ